MRFGADRWSPQIIKTVRFPLKTILLKCSLRGSDEKIELLQKNKAFLKIDWKHHVNISVYVRGGLDRKTH